jgi:hypothetical protein
MGWDSTATDFGWWGTGGDRRCDLDGLARCEDDFRDFDFAVFAGLAPAGASLDRFGRER